MHRPIRLSGSAALAGILAMSFAPGAHAAADPWCRPSHDDVLAFEWAPDDPLKPNTGSVRVKDARTGAVLQVLPGLENHVADAADPQAAAFRHGDLNNDGCGDLAVETDVAPIGNASFAVFLYDRTTRRFVANQALSEAGVLDVDPRDRNCLTGLWKGGAADFSSARYCWRGRRLVLTEEWSTSPVDREDGSRCYRHVHTTYVRGRRKTKTTCDPDL